MLLQSRHSGISLFEQKPYCSNENQLKSNFLHKTHLKTKLYHYQTLPPHHISQNQLIYNHQTPTIILKSHLLPQTLISYSSHFLLTTKQTTITTTPTTPLTQTQLHNSNTQLQSQLQTPSKYQTLISQYLHFIFKTPNQNLKITTIIT